MSVSPKVQAFIAICEDSWGRGANEEEAKARMVKYNGGMMPTVWSVYLVKGDDKPRVDERRLIRFNGRDEDCVLIAFQGVKMEPVY